MKTTTLLTLGASLALAATSSAVTIFEDDFDALSAGNLSGQGGWTGPTGPNVSTDPGSFGFSGNIVSYTAVDNQPSHSLSGFNDTGIATIEFDLRINGDTNFTGITLGTSGLGFRVNRGNVNLFETDGGLISFDHNFSGDHVYHSVLTIDPTAFGGAGSASLTFAQYTAESTTAAAVSAFTDEQLDLNGAGNALSGSSHATLRLHNADSATSVARLDNLLITQAVPEPSSAALLGLGGLALILRRRK